MYDECHLGLCEQYLTCLRTNLSLAGVFLIFCWRQIRRNIYRQGDQRFLNQRDVHTLEYIFRIFFLFSLRKNLRFSLSFPCAVLSREISCLMRVSTLHRRDVNGEASIGSSDAFLLIKDLR